MRLKGILVFGLLVLCVVAVLPTAVAATTYNVTSADDFWNVSKLTQSTSGMDVVINVKNDISFSVYHDIVFSNATVLINGGNKNITLVGSHDSAGIVVQNSNVTVKNLNFKNSNSSNSNNISLIGSVGRDSLIIDGCNFENNTVRYLISRIYPSGVGSVKVSNCDFLNNTAYLIYVANNTTSFNVDNVTVLGNKYNAQGCLFGAVQVDNVIFNDLKVRNNTVSLIGFSLSRVNSFLIENCTIENNTMPFFAGSTIATWFDVGNSSGIIRSNYFGNSVGGSSNNNSTLFWFSNSDVEIKQNTFYLNDFSTFVTTRLGGSVKVLFNTVYGTEQSQGDVFSFGNLFVTSAEYVNYFGSNQPALNGGKTKSIKLSDKEENFALNKISLADYQLNVGINPNSDTDQSGKKRIYGSAVDYGSLELQTNPIQNIIDNIVDIFKPKPTDDLNSDGLDDSGLFSKTKPSMIMFLFGDDPFLKRTQSLLYFIVSNWVKLDVPIISDVSQGFINVVGWES
jgi:hypothetical protein